MAKSLRSKREKRLRTLRREIAEPFYEKKDEAKLKAQEAALAAPKLPVRNPTRDDNVIASESASTAQSMDVEMAEGNSRSSLRPVGGVGKKKSKKNWKIHKAKLKAKKGKNKW